MKKWTQLLMVLTFCTFLSGSIFKFLDVHSECGNLHQGSVQAWEGRSLEAAIQAGAMQSQANALNLPRHRQWFRQAQLPLRAVNISQRITGHWDRASKSDLVAGPPVQLWGPVQSIETPRGGARSHISAHWYHGVLWVWLLLDAPKQ